MVMYLKMSRIAPANIVRNDSPGKGSNSNVSHLVTNGRGKGRWVKVTLPSKMWQELKVLHLSYQLVGTRQSKSKPLEYCPQPYIKSCNLNQKVDRIFSKFKLP